MATTRGQIISPDRARQIRDFSGLLFGTITPTDIDGLIEYHKRAYVIIETKLSGARERDGQRLALQRLTDDLHRAHRPSICIIAAHNTDDISQPIDVANAVTIEYRYKRHWHRPKKIYTVRETIETFLKAIEPPALVVEAAQ